ncbi:MAG: FmdB family zinc ribbon protein [Rubripirellula sp.]
MPLYEFECKSCDSVVEVLVRSTSETKACPDCGNVELKRLLSVPASPAIASKSSLPTAGGGDACGAPRCCGGGCQD